MKTLITLAALAALTLTSAFPAESAPKAPLSKPDGVVQISIRLGDLASAYPALRKLFSLELPVKLAYSLRKTVASVETEIKQYEEQRIALVKKHDGKPDQSGMAIFTSEQGDAFAADYKQLVEIKVELSITPIPLAALGDAKMSAGDMQKLDPFLEKEK